MTLRDQTLIQTLSVKPPIQLPHSKDLFLPPTHQISYDLRKHSPSITLGVGAPSWNSTYIFWLSGQNQTLINQVQRLHYSPPLNELWNEFTFDFEGVFHGHTFLFNIDSGCSGLVFNEALALKHNFTIYTGSPQIIKFANNNTIVSNKFVNLKFCKEEYSQTLSFQLIPNLTKPAMFGILFFQNKLIQINWTSNCFHFKVCNSLIF